MARTGRPPYQPTERDRDTVKVMVAAGIEHANIARCLRIAQMTLRKHFREEIDTSAERANAQVAGVLFKRATNPSDPSGVTAAIWWTKTRMGWKEKNETAITGADGKELIVRIGGADAEL